MPAIRIALASSAYRKISHHARASRRERRRGGPRRAWLCHNLYKTGRRDRAGAIQHVPNEPTANIPISAAIALRFRQDLLRNTACTFGEAAPSVRPTAAVGLHTPCWDSL